MPSFSIAKSGNHDQVLAKHLHRLVCSIRLVCYGQAYVTVLDTVVLVVNAMLHKEQTGLTRMLQNCHGSKDLEMQMTVVQVLCLT